MTEQFANNASTTLNGSITSSATSLVVTSAADMPPVPQFRLRIDDEFILVTALAGTTFTVTRGVEGSVAASHANGAAVDHVVTADAIRQLKADAQGWITALDYDFTAQGAQTLATDGTYTIGGVTWTKVNSASDNGPLTMSAADGLLLQPKGDNSNYNESHFSAMGLRLPLSQIIADLAFGMELRIWAYVAANNSAANYDSATLAVDYAPNSTYVFVRGFAGSQYFYTSVGNAGATIAGATADTQNLSDDVYVLNVPSFGDPEAAGRSGAWSAGWPAAKDLHTHAKVTGSVVMPAMGSPSDWALSLYGVRVTSGTALQIKVKQLRVDYRY